MKAYNFDSTGSYTGEIECAIDPLETISQGKDIYLLPANAVTIAPPEYDTNKQYPFWDGAAWSLMDLPDMTPDADVVKADRKTAIKAACEAAIVAGFDADVLGRGTLHYTLTSVQQRDLDKLMQSVKDGATSVFWHDDSRVTHEAYLATQFKALYQTGYAFMIGCKIRSDWLEQYAIDLADSGDLTTAQTVDWDTVLPDTYQTQADAQISAMLGISNATT